MPVYVLTALQVIVSFACVLFDMHSVCGEFIEIENEKNQINSRKNTPTFFIKKIDLQGNILCIQKKNEKANFAT